MSDDPGFCLAGWSDIFSCWVSIGVGRDRGSIEHLAGRLAMLGIVLRVVPVSAVDDFDAEEAALSKVRPPRGAFVAHDVGDPNA